jgi:glycosyltransferase involved in cell wall biosynthesis
MTQPLVSIIMPVYNCEKYVAEAIESILTQTYKNIELICINDASTDKSRDVLKSFGDRITLIDLDTNKGIAKGRNVGIPFSAGEFIAFADADDIWNPQKLFLQMEQFSKDPYLDISFCMIQNFLSPDASKELGASRQFPTGPIPGQISGTFVAKRSSFDRVGLLDEVYRVGEFIDWMARAHELGLKQSMVPEVLYLRRAHETNTTLSKATRVDYLKIAKAALERKRASKS